MSPSIINAPPAARSTSVFKDDIFAGKVVLATGGGSGICKGQTEALMRHGCDAVILGRNVERLEAAAKDLEGKTGRRCLAAQADVRDPEAVKRAVEKGVERFGRIDFVICGAAGNFLAPISGLSVNAFRTVVEIDLIGCYNTIKATLPHVQKRGGAYLHVSATLHYRGTPLQAHVSAAKAGIDALSSVLAVEGGPHGVRSNVVAPGPIKGTEGMDKLTIRDEKGEVPQGEEWGIPAGRMGEVEDIANTTVFLFSDAANWITGQVIAVDGGELHTRAWYGYPRSLLQFEELQKAGRVSRGRDEVEKKAKGAKAKL